MTRSSQRASIELAWQVGRRYRFGATSFTGAQFADALLERYIPWREGDFYTQQQLLAFQQRLIDADYFALTQVEPDADHAHDGVIPIKVLLAPAKRTIYTGGVFVGTDTVEGACIVLPPQSQLALKVEYLGRVPGKPADTSAVEAGLTLALHSELTCVRLSKIRA